MAEFPLFICAIYTKVNKIASIYSVYIFIGNADNSAFQPIMGRCYISGFYYPDKRAMNLQAALLLLGAF
jgi:hypothetical protein